MERRMEKKEAGVVHTFVSGTVATLVVASLIGVSYDRISKSLASEGRDGQPQPQEEVQQ
jgi:hypothetical protein